MSIEKIANYTILDKISNKTNEIAFGFNENSPTPYATWERNLIKDKDGEPNFQLGHYFSTKDEALKDFKDRSSKLRSSVVEKLNQTQTQQAESKPISRDNQSR